ncbi:cell division protein ZapA [Paracoccaceae bacterium]|nr:cell division protein ZapA [Paracoccaceae bacterium]
MPEVAINIGNKKFTVTCQPGEESALEAAASLLNDEAAFLISEIGQLSEQKLLLMSGLMLADKMTTQSEKLAKSEIALEEALKKAQTLEENVNLQQVPVAEDLLEEFMTITEKAEKLASRISN